ncbi:MAG: hypothetical protein MMC33_005229 [Icmadophila ericetorum]|nr:hypothetical protein [Icmadophila ericetorum]
MPVAQAYAGFDIIIQVEPTDGSSGTGTQSAIEGMTAMFPVWLDRVKALRIFSFGLLALSSIVAALPTGAAQGVARRNPLPNPYPSFLNSREISTEGYDGDSEDIVKPHKREISTEGYDGDSEDIVRPHRREISTEGYDGDSEDIVRPHKREISTEGYDGDSEDIVRPHKREISTEGYDGDDEGIVRPH